MSGKNKKLPFKKKHSRAYKIWHFLWYEDSLLSWIVNIILAFIIIKFLLYPGIGMVMGTRLPVVAVISPSMEHHGSFDDWWNSLTALCSNGRCSQAEFYAEHNISLEDFKRFPLKNGFNKGDIIILVGVNPEKVKIGDVIVFSANTNYPVIHRVIHIYHKDNKTFFVTKGDNNQASIETITLNEKRVSEDQLIGKAVFRIPLLGYVKIIFTDLIKLLVS